MEVARQEVYLTTGKSATAEGGNTTGGSRDNRRTRQEGNDQEDRCNTATEVMQHCVRQAGWGCCRRSGNDGDDSVGANGEETRDDSVELS
jgi:hypothetical protein